MLLSDTGSTKEDSPPDRAPNYLFTCTTYYDHPRKPRNRRRVSLARRTEDNCTATHHGDLRTSQSRPGRRHESPVKRHASPQPSLPQAAPQCGARSVVISIAPQDGSRVRLHTSQRSSPNERPNSLRAPDAQGSTPPAWHAAGSRVYPRRQRSATIAPRREHPLPRRTCPLASPPYRPPAPPHR